MNSAFDFFNKIYLNSSFKLALIRKDVNGSKGGLHKLLEILLSHFLNKKKTK